MKLIHVVFLLISTARAHSDCDLQEELNREWKADTALHDCRVCDIIPKNDEDNCPQMNYECEEDLTLTSNVLNVDDCSCSVLQCRDANATLAVGGQIVRKVRCKDRVWTAPPNITAASAVCARRCDLGICPVLPSEVFLGQDILGPLPVSPPDENHPCAWADCTIGAIAQQESTEIVYRGSSSFSCSGNTLWKYTGPGPIERHLKDVACIIKDCEKLPFGGESEMCDSKYACYEPDFVDGTGEIWKKMICVEEGALRFSYDDTKGAPTCKIAQWSEEGNNIADTTEVVCVTCPSVKTEETDNVKPDVSDYNKEATCSRGKLTIEYESGGPQSTQVTTLTCSPTFAWTSTGGTFTPFSSLEDLVSQDVSWKARCITDCETLPFGGQSAICQSKYACYEPNFVGGSEQGSMTCPEPGALRLSESDQHVTPTCNSGQWSDEGDIASSTEVVCVTCPPVQKEPSDATQPDVSEKNKAVTCISGYQLTIEYESGGPQQTSVATLTCSSTFAWTATGGSFTPYSSLADLVSQGVPWKVRCIEAPSIPCATLPTTMNAPFCYDVPFPNAKYWCPRLPTYEPESEFQGSMQCLDPAFLRYASDADKIIVPTCINGAWFDNGEAIPDTTEVACVRCRPLTKIDNDVEKWEYETLDGSKIICLTKPLYVDIQSEDAQGFRHSITKIPADAVVCNPATQIWEAEGADLGEYISLDNILVQGTFYALRCLGPDELDT